MTTTTSLFQLRFIKKGLEFEIRTGMKVSRISARDAAKRVLCIPSKSRIKNAELLAELDILIEQAEKLFASEAK
jgi:hypothetical protein